MNKVKVIGAGLAGAEAVWQLSKRGIDVVLYEQKPKKFSPAHSNSNFAEIVCSNSFKSTDLATASGLLKAEMEKFDSLIIKTAKECSVPAGGALAVDRELFSQKITEKIKSLKNVEIVYEEVKDFDKTDTIIATGPLTSDDLYQKLTKFLGEDSLHFFDASAPIISGESIDLSKTFTSARYGRGESDYINCPLTKDEYYNFVNELKKAEKVTLHSFEKEEIFDGCMPIEVMAERGEESLRFGPMRPVGLKTNSGEKPYAVLQLRRENTEGSLYNLVGFQTNLTFGEQKRVFSLIPALKNAEFIKFGVMHRNSFINAPKFLEKDFSVKNFPTLFIAGQLSGVEGYMESTMSGLIAGISLAKKILGEKPLEFSPNTMIGAITGYLTTKNSNFQPMNANFGILPPLDFLVKDKQQRKLEYSKRALNELEGE